MFRTLHQLVVRTGAIAIATGLVAPANAAILNAEMNNADLLGLIEGVHLEMVDEVSDGCWTNIGDVQDQVRSAFEAANISVRSIETADSATHPALIVSARGQRVDDSYCIVQTEIRMSFVTSSRFAEASEGGDVYIINYNSVSNMFRANVAVVSNENVNAEVSTWVEQVTNALTAEINAKRELPGLAGVREQLGLSN